MKIVKHVLSRTPQQARTDIGGPSAPGVGQAGSSVQEDNAAGVLHHSLYSPGADGGGGTTSSSYLGEIWKDLQAQGKYEMRFKRIMLLKASRRRTSYVPPCTAATPSSMYDDAQRIYKRYAYWAG
jgi:hypothetical protein